jgi:hypothetical protein
MPGCFQLGSLGMDQALETAHRLCKLVLRLVPRLASDVDVKVVAMILRALTFARGWICTTWRR